MAEARPLPARATLLFLYEKYNHEVMFETYLMDMLWAPAHGRQYKDYKRYHEMRFQEQKQIQESTEKITKKSVKNMFSSMKSEGK